MDIRVRTAQAADADALSELAARVFRETFGSASDPVHLAAHVARSFSPALQAREIADHDVTTLVAEGADGLLLAYAQVRTGTPPPVVTTPVPLQLWRFYVDPVWHGRGLARRLMHAVFEVVVERGGQSVWLTVWERNPRAVSFYTTCGFEDVGSCPYLFGDEVQTDRVMTHGVAG